jgi:vacuolar-type H+-ATPase subunit I/STV1
MAGADGEFNPAGFGGRVSLMGRQGAIRAARAAMKREGRKPEEIPAQPPSFTARREATVKLLSALDASRAEVRALRVAHAEYERDAEAVHAEVAGERDALAAEVKRLAVERDDLRAEVERLRALIHSSPPVHFATSCTVEGSSVASGMACGIAIEHARDDVPEELGYTGDRAKVRGCVACVAAAAAEAAK